MPSIPQKDRVSLCRYSYADERQCRTPRSPRHPHFCYFHARRESQSVAVDKLADDLAYFFSGRYTSANDLCAAMGLLIPAVVRGDIKPHMASTLAYLAQTFIQAIQLAQKEYIYAFGTPEWGAEIRNNVNGNVDRLNEIDPAPETPAPNAQAETNPNSAQASLHNRNSDHTGPRQACSGESLDPCSCSDESSDSDEDIDDEDTDQNPDEQLDSDNSAPTPEPLTPLEATLAKK